MGAHVLSAGNGYTYPTSQVAAHDVTGISPGGLGAYYAEQGEAPGRWLGSGLTSLGIEPGSLVSEAQMVALFGEGRHPDAAAITSALLAESAGLESVEAATALGTAFKVNVAANEFTRQVAVLMAEWNTAQGAPASAPVPDYMKARIRTAVGQSLFAREHGREAADARELSGFINTASRIATRTVAGYDLTFSPVKSVSVLWALAPAAVAEQIQAAHQAAVQDTFGWLERTAVYTRLGRNGIRQVDVRGLVATAFVHRTSRAGDPDLHTHVAVSNKVQTLDGKWRALDGRVLLKATVAASERYNTRLEAELRDRLGVRFAERPVASPEKRSVREIVGVDPRLLDQWSGRRKDITERQAALSASFQAEHGRLPTPVEAIALAQQATLAGRQAKQAPRSEGDQRAQWHGQAIATLTEPGLAAMVSTVLTPAAEVASVLTGEQMLSIAQRVIDRVQADRATWQRWHVLAEAQR